MFDGLINTISSIGKGIFSFFDTLSGGIISGLISIIQAIFYGLTTLISKVWNLFLQLIDGGVFVNIGRAFDTISSYIGGPATVFLASMLFLVFVRIVIAFVFKIFRLNIDYHTDRAKTEKNAAEDFKRNNNLFS